MNPDVAEFAQVMAVIVGTICSLGLFVLVGRILWRMGTRSVPPSRYGLESPDVQRLETAIDAIAVEVERISEAQRFTVALLSESLPRGTPENSRNS